MNDEGSDNRKVQLRGTSWHLTLFGQAGIMIRRFGRLIGFAGQDHAGRRSRATTDDTGAVDWVTTGISPQGEENTLYVCRRLIEALRERGEEWGEPVEGRDEPVDCECSNPRGDKLQIQVVRAAGESFWEELSKARQIGQRGITPEELASALREPIAKKARKLGPNERANLILALDATRTPASALTSVVEEFRGAHGAWCASLGFSAVWVVGPYSSFVERLDVGPA